jgi:hypothetical protein
MPGLRFGPDITDDAARLQDLAAEQERIIKRPGASARAVNAARNRLKAIDQTTKQIFGSKTNRNSLAKYSTARQGYLPGGGRSRNASGRRGAAGTTVSPVGLATQIPARRRGESAARFRQRPSIPEKDRGKFRAASRRARPGQAAQILQNVIREQQAQTRAANRRRARTTAATRTRRG